MRRAIAVALLLLACRPPPKPAHAMSIFNIAELEPYRGDGTATIEGEAFTKTRGGDVKPCAGETAYLVPVTAYTQEWLEHAIIAGDRVSGVDRNMFDFFRSITTDGSGGFRFENLPDGDYYVTCEVTWEVPRVVGTGLGYITVMDRTGGVVFGRGTAKAGQTTRVIVSR